MCRPELTASTVGLWRNSKTRIPKCRHGPSVDILLFLFGRNTLAEGTQRPKGAIAKMKMARYALQFHSVCLVAQTRAAQTHTPASPSENTAFQLAIDKPISAQATSSQRISGALRIWSIS